MHLPRKSLATATLVAALFETPAIATAHAPGAAGGLDHGPATQLATLDQRVRQRRRIRGTRLRTIVWRTVRHLRETARAIGVGDQEPPATASAS